MSQITQIRHRLKRAIEERDIIKAYNVIDDMNNSHGYNLALGELAMLEGEYRNAVKMIGILRNREFEV